MTYLILLVLRGVWLDPLVGNEQRQVRKPLGDHFRTRLSVGFAEQSSSQVC